MAENGFAKKPEELQRGYRTFDGKELKHGDVLIAAITSCTNTSNPGVLLAAGLLAKKAVELGLTVKPHIKTSLAPGSRVVTEYLTKSGLLPYLEKLGFFLAGYGCTTCIGNSGPLAPAAAPRSAPPAPARHRRRPPTPPPPPRPTAPPPPPAPPPHPHPPPAPRPPPPPAPPAHRHASAGPRRGQSNSTPATPRPSL